jgi:hypothetical protein
MIFFTTAMVSLNILVSIYSLRLFFTYVYAPKIVLLFFCVFRLPASLLVKRPLAYRELNTHEAGEQRIAVHAGIGLGHGWVLVGATQLIIILVRRKWSVREGSNFFPGL